MTQIPLLTSIHVFVIFPLIFYIYLAIYQYTHVIVTLSINVPHEPFN